MTDRLKVLLNGEHVADLVSAGPGWGASLTYTSAAVEKYGPGASLLSTALPVRRESFPWFECCYFLEGCLPEDGVRKALADLARVPEDDTFALLAVYGLDCAGAVSFVAEGVDEERARGVRWLNDEELQDALDGLPVAPFGVDLDRGVRVSLGGLQGKLVAVRGGQGFGTPIGMTPSTHILKPAPYLPSGRGERWPGISWLEHFAMTVVRRASVKGDLVLSAPNTEVISVGRRDVLVVERFDRRVADSGAVRIHQEDFCQALRIREKYQQSAHDGPFLADVARVLRSKADRRELEALLERVVFSVILGDGDMHARNLSLVLEGGSIKLSPAYDIVPTVQAGGDTRLALRVGGEEELEDVTRAHVLDEAKSWGIRARPAAATLDRVLDAAEAVIGEAAEEMDHPKVGLAVRWTQAKIAALRTQGYGA
ncbi:MULTISPECIES: HipA domain-containing protein [Arthrobacter]|uniref:HipA domain-containing protein n=2 Tax=Arthrobacter TaxID=1663 RepID=A0ABU9KIH1_9MICC|nr:HipA domain-containing protein [Arthrobacter sp. YJM1]MDP5226613.1 HipA domain-containing protein [Arthrobacter sp. YJM1]